MGVSGVGANRSALGVHGWIGFPPTPPAKNAVTACAAQPLKSLPITEWPVYGTTSSCASGISAATRRALEVGRPQVLRAGEDQRRHVRQRARSTARGRRVGPAGAGWDEAAVAARCSRRTGRSPRSAGRAGRRGLRASACSPGAGALPGKRRLLAGRCHEQRFVDLLGAFFDRVAARHVGDQPLGEQLQAQQRIGVIAQRRVHRGGQQRAQGGVQVACLEDAEQARPLPAWRCGGGPSRRTPSRSRHACATAMSGSRRPPRGLA